MASSKLLQTNTMYLNFPILSRVWRSFVLKVPCFSWKYSWGKKFSVYFIGISALINSAYKGDRLKRWYPHSVTVVVGHVSLIVSLASAVTYATSAASARQRWFFTLSSLKSASTPNSLSNIMKHIGCCRFIYMPQSSSRHCVSCWQDFSTMLCKLPPSSKPSSAAFCSSSVSSVPCYVSSTFTSQCSSPPKNNYRAPRSPSKLISKSSSKKYHSATTNLGQARAR